MAPLVTICMKCQILFPGKNKKNISKCRLLKTLPRVLSVYVSFFFSRFILHFRARFLPLLESAREDCLKVVVGTKSDLVESREITPEEAKQFSREINQNVNLSKLKSDPYFETSSKTGNNVTRVFEYIFDYCLPLSDEEKKHSHSRRDTVQLYDTSTENKRGCCKSWSLLKALDKMIIVMII